MVKLRSPYDREIGRLAIPALGTLVAEPLYVLADTAIVGRLGTNELAGLALASTILLSVHSLMIFLAYGTTSTVARLIGAEQKREAAHQSVQGLWLASILGTMAAIALVFAGRPLLVLLGGHGEALVAAERYLRISLIGVPFMLLNLAGAGSYNGRQDTRTPLAVAVGGAIANLVIELILVPGLGFGVGASALATVVAQVGTGLLLAWRVLHWSKAFNVGTSIDLVALSRLMVSGQALILRSVTLRGSFTLGTAVAARIGVAELAAHQVALQIWSTLALALDAVAIAGQAITGKWLGAAKPKRAIGAAKRMIQLDVGIGIAAALVLITIRTPLATLFSTDPAVIDATAFVLVWVAATQPLNGYVFALDGILIGAGDLRYLGRAMAVTGTLFAIGAVYLVRYESGLNALWALITGFMAARAIALWWRWRSDRWIVLGSKV